ncbi:glycosyltransferase family 4 protein [Sphingomonas cannabina]|uniref:glycosyltransferase family 4 protein n=1 Tax=Sphingomonas cannabina TaxID=2899123 RepID=UPI001F4620F5|nr:glycosyltransferase family 4 protein [Sphingomonas cannabina]UIJ47439.1 glycosyltransferase family 4 protein [Sphingomonas cannabina]
MNRREPDSERALRLLIVSQYFWPENFRINDLSAELVRRGHEVTVLTGKPNYPEGYIFPAYRADPAAFDRFGDVPVIRVPVIPRGQSSLWLMLNYLSFAISASLVGTWKLRGRPFDAIFVFQTSPITAALPAALLRRLKRAPMLMWILDLWPDTLSAIGVVKSPRLLSAVGRLVRFVYAQCDRILVQSRAFEPKVARLAGGAGKIRYFPGWAEAIFDTGSAAPVEAAPELAPYADDFKILFAGNIGEAQDFPAILDAADALRDTPGVRWLVVGDGRAAPQVREEIRRRGLTDRVVLLGRYPLERMPSFFAGADALLVTLRNEPVWSMTIPGKVQSYLAAGKPLLTMLDGEGARVIKEAGAGLVAPAGDGPALAAQARRLMEMDGEQRASMGRNGRRYGLQEFGRQHMVDALVSWIDECRVGKKSMDVPTATRS